MAAFPITLSSLVIIAGVLNAQATLLPISNVVVFVVFVVFVGIAEEFFFRGCIANILADKYLKSEKGLYITVFISGCIFGAMHLINLFSGVEISGVIIQAICTIPIGCLFTAIYLRTKNIWLLVFIHGLNDFAGLINSGLYGVDTVESAISGYSYLQLISIFIYLIPVFFC